MRLAQLVDDFWTSLDRGDIPRLEYMGGRIALLAGEVFLLRIAIRILERARGALVATEGER